MEDKPRNSAVETGMAAQQQHQTESLISGQYLGEISALCFLHLPHDLSPLPFLLAGSGSELLLYDLSASKIVCSFPVFRGIRVHGITCAPSQQTSSSAPAAAFHIAIFGEKRVKLFNLLFDLTSTSTSHSNDPRSWVDFSLLQSLPRFTHWVLDVSFFEDCNGGHTLAIGCSNNSVSIWDVSTSTLILQAQSSDRCLLYSMRLWGHSLQDLRIACGTIYNEIIIWKVVSSHEASPLTNTKEDRVDNTNSFSNDVQLVMKQPETLNVCRLIGHEGSIFRIAWSFTGSKLVSVSDDRSARIWELCHDSKNSDNTVEISGPGCVGPVLFGHTARIWDCFVSDSLIVTAGEDCTCRVWALDGRQLKMIKEHVGRGIWRCLYDPESSLLVTAGFDSAIKVHHLNASLSGGLEGHIEVKQFIDRTEIFTARIPHSAKHIKTMDSKSEYVRCLGFACEDVLYIATNLGYLYHANLSDKKDVNWTELVRVSDEVPIVCMDLFLSSQSEAPYVAEDWISIGDGKGNMTVIPVSSNAGMPKVTDKFAWTAEMERQLLGTYFCKSLGHRYVFTANPKGALKLWRLGAPVEIFSSSSSRSHHVSLIAEFFSCYGMRIMCLDASFEGEVLVCGDLHGNLVLFPLLKDLLLSTSGASVGKIPPTTYFKGAHGISAVSSISLATLNFNQLEICSAGADGCICYFDGSRGQENLEFIGMKQVKELSLVKSVFADKNSPEYLANSRYAAGFASTDFIIWNLVNEAKVVQIPCGGWRRPHSYYLGAVPEMMNCFAYVKDEIIYIHKNWAKESNRKIFPQNLHVQFHGREIHSVCFVTEDLILKENVLYSGCNWIATGCEDGTVRLTRYTPSVDAWAASKLLGEHVGGSAVRSICFVSKLQVIGSDTDEEFGSGNGLHVSTSSENPLLLISVGAKRVLTSWILRNRRLNVNDSLAGEQQNKNGDGCEPVSRMSSSISFQWLSTDMPTRCSVPHGKLKSNDKSISVAKDDLSRSIDPKCKTTIPKNQKSKAFLGNKHEDDWRYLAVTAFLVKFIGSRVTVCFVVVACSDATLALRALILPYRLWFDIAVLAPLSSPILALKHVIVPLRMVSEGKTKARNVYIVISGATDGSIAFWDLTQSVETFMLQVSKLQVERFIDSPKRPCTGRGSQGGRWWRLLSGSIYRKSQVSVAKRDDCEGSSQNLCAQVSSGTTCNISESEGSTASFFESIDSGSHQSGANADEFSSDICEIWPLYVLSNFHQSGVNCLHVSDVRNSQSSHSGSEYNLISGGDDQALHCLIFELSALPQDKVSERNPKSFMNSLTECDSTRRFVCCDQNQKNYRVRLLYHNKIASAHSSAIKGVWTDGNWVFSTGLDQRVRCWHLGRHGELMEHCHLVVSVPEPEALDARVCRRNQYLIAVAGRGMQMVEFSTSCDVNKGE